MKKIISSEASSDISWVIYTSVKDRIYSEVMMEVVPHTGQNWTLFGTTPLDQIDTFHYKIDCGTEFIRVIIQSSLKS